LDMLNQNAAQEPVLLRLRASSRSWRDLCRPRLLADCAARLASEDPSVRLAAVCILGTAGDWEGYEGRGITIQEARNAAAQGLEDADPDVRRLAVRTLAHLVDQGDAKAFSRIAFHLQMDPAWPVRWAAVDALVHMAGDARREEAAELLEERLEDRDWPVRRAAVGALAKAAEAAAVVTRVRRLLYDEEEDVRVAVVRVLAQLAAPGDRSAVASFVERAGDKRPAVRRAAVVALGRVADRSDMSVVTALNAARRDKEESVQEAAYAALERLGA